MNLFTQYPLFWPAVWHNIIWLLVLVFIATPIGMFLAVLLDREMRGTRIYQSASSSRSSCRWPSSGSSGSCSTRSQGFINSVLGQTATSTAIDFLGDPSINLWAVLVAASWRHVGYVMVLYLAGLKSVDPTLREAAAIDGANARQTFFRVVFPVMRPINVVIVVVTVIESLRAFDIAYIINQGKNGLELLSILITNNSISEASLLGFGSAIAVVLLRHLARSRSSIFLVRIDARTSDMTAVATPRRLQRRGPRRRRPRALAADRPARVPHRRWPASGCSRSLWAFYTALRPYGDTAPNGYVSLPHEPELRQLRRRLGPGRDRPSTSSTR